MAGDARGEGRIDVCERRGRKRGRERGGEGAREGSCLGNMSRS